MTGVFENVNDTSFYSKRNQLHNMSKVVPSDTKVGISHISDDISQTSKGSPELAKRGMSSTPNLASND